MPSAFFGIITTHGASLSHEDGCVVRGLVFCFRLRQSVLLTHDNFRATVSVLQSFWSKHVLLYWRTSCLREP